VFPCSIWRPGLFALVGAANTGVDFTTYVTLTRWWHIDPITANVVGFMLGSLNSYVFNAKLTFRDVGLPVLSSRRMLLFAATTLLCLALSTLVLYSLLDIMPDLLAKGLAVGVTFIVGYWLNRVVVFIG
jgi:putative flippase GtrA